MRREEEPGNQTTPGDDARRLRREEEPGNQTT
ncbi:cell wall anchor protein, partial [Mycobacterium tuberculosis]